jgi:two-component system, LytTR family, response regulator LytT
MTKRDLLPGEVDAEAAEPDAGPTDRTLGAAVRSGSPAGRDRGPEPACARRRRARAGAVRIAARARNELVFLDPATVWAFEAAGRLTFVHSCEGRFDVDLSLAAFERRFGGALVRVHRNWLVHLEHVRAMHRENGEVTLVVGASLRSHRIEVPVSRDRVPVVRRLLLRGATGVRRREASRAT